MYTGSSTRPPVLGFIGGLGGREVTVPDVEKMTDLVFQLAKGNRNPLSSGSGCLDNDNESYANSDIQISGTSPYGANTSFSTPGKVKRIMNHRWKKNMAPLMMVGHPTVEYVGTISTAYPLQAMNNIRKALSIGGPTFIHCLNSGGVGMLADDQPPSPVRAIPAWCSLRGARSCRCSRPSRRTCSAGNGHDELRAGLHRKGHGVYFCRAMGLLM
jgi:hypothetical protein